MYTTLAKTMRETIIVSNSIETRWHHSNKKWYESRGYSDYSYNAKLIVDVNDVPPGSRASVVVMCPVCREEREIKINDLSKTGHTICRRCAKIKDISGKKFGRLLAIKPVFYQDIHGGAAWEFLCDCGNYHIADSYTVSSGRTSSCGCAFDFIEYSRGRTGEKNPAYNPLLTDEDRKSRRVKVGYKSWRRSVYQRDEYKCRKCSRGGSIVAHHLFPYSTHKEFRLLTENGVTLCKSCHYNFHISFMGGWAIPCTPSDYMRWIGS